MDKAISLLTELRHWRAALPTGLFFAAFVLLETLRYVSTVSTDALPTASTVRRLLELLPPAVLAVTGVVLVLLLGTWWCAFAAWCFSWVQIGTLHALPIHEPSNKWSRWQRLISPLPARDLSQLQRTLSSSPDFSDLLKNDQKGAHIIILSDVIHASDTSLSELPGSSDAVRALTDARTLAGILPWAPLCVWSIGSGLGREFSAAPEALTLCAVGILVVIALSLWRQGRIAVGSASRLMASDERVSASARAAQGWGLNAAARKNLENDLV